MIKRLIGTLGLFAIMLWVGVCGAGYVLDFFGVLRGGWFSEAWLISHPMFDLSLLALVLVGTYNVMSSTFDLMGIIKDEPGDTKKARTKSFADFADHLRLSKREKKELIALFNAIEESEDEDELAERLEAMGLDDELIKSVIQDLRCSDCEEYVDGVCTILRSKGEPEEVEPS